jgi:hypothetical protein
MPTNGLLFPVHYAAQLFSHDYYIFLPLKIYVTCDISYYIVWQMKLLTIPNLAKNPVFLKSMEWHKICITIHIKN